MANGDAPPALGAARSGAAVGIAQLASMGVSFLLSAAIAALFGAAGTTDAYFMASSSAELLAKILLGGALTSVLLPTFVGFQVSGDADRAWRLFSSLLTLAGITFLVFGGLLELAASPLVAFLAPGFPSDTRALTVVLLRLVIPAYLLSFLADLVTVPLHAHRRFGLPAASRLVVPTLTLLLLLAFAHRIGIRALAVGTLLGTALQLVLLLTAVRSAGFRFALPRPLVSAEVRGVLARTLPFALSILAAHGAGIVYRILVSHEPEGSLASLKFAEKIFQMANVLFLGTITQIAFPAFSRVVASGSHTAIRETFRTGLRAVMFFGVPLTVGIILLRTPLVRVLYERGAFTPEATAGTALLVPLFLVGLLGNGFSSLLGHLALAFRETRGIVGVNIALQAIAAGLFVLTTPRFGIAGLAAVSGLGPFVLTALYAWGFRERLKGLRSVVADVAFLKMLLAGVACGLLVTLSERLLADIPAAIGRDVARLALGGSAGLTAYLSVAWLLRLEEVRTIGALAWNTFRRTR